MEKVKMLEQESAVKNAEQDLRELAENEETQNSNENQESMKQFEESVITGDQLAQIRALMAKRPKQLARDHVKIGRNDECPCGSGKKYKNCCMDSGKFEGMHEVKKNR